MHMRMKRLLFVSAVVAALLVPSTALSSSQGYSSASAEAKRGFSLSFFIVNNRQGKPKRITNIEYSDVTLNCDVGAPLIASGGPYGPAKVENKEFKKTFPTTHAGGEGKFKIVGEFKQHFSQVKGYIKKTGDYPDLGREGCNSGKVNYVAS
jgi:hypothetical protein